MNVNAIAPHPPPAPPDALAAAWRSLLSPTERAVVGALWDRGNRRMTIVPLRMAAERRVADGIISEGVMKFILARLVSVGLLENSRSARPPGYRLTDSGLSVAEAL